MESFFRDSSAETMLCFAQMNNFFPKTGSAAYGLLKVLAAHGRLETSLYDEDDLKDLRTLCKQGSMEEVSEYAVGTGYGTVYVSQAEEKLRYAA